jgi:hypothetical protein
VSDFVDGDCVAQTINWFTISEGERQMSWQIDDDETLREAERRGRARLEAHSKQRAEMLAERFGCSVRLASYLDSLERRIRQMERERNEEK